MHMNACIDICKCGWLFVCVNVFAYVRVYICKQGSKRAKAGLFTLNQALLFSGWRSGLFSKKHETLFQSSENFRSAFASDGTNMYKYI